VTIDRGKLTVRVIVLLLTYRYDRVQVRALVCRDRLIANEESSVTLETLCQFRGIGERSFGKNGGSQLIFGVLLPFVALVIVGGLLALLLVKHGIGEVKGLWQTTSSKNPSKLSEEKPSPQEFKTPYKPYKQSTQEEHQPAKMDEANPGNGNPWRW
jgi:hypothetical protein